MLLENALLYQKVIAVSSDPRTHGRILENRASPGGLVMEITSNILCLLLIEISFSLYR